MKYFNGVTSLDELKKEYRRLSMINHPDRGGNIEIMKAINAEHDDIFEILKKQHNASADEYHQTTETAEEFREIITALLNIGSDITVELCGSWLWISGETKAHKEELKALSCRWSDNKKMWYWRHPEDGRPYRKSKSSMSDIRFKYGSQVFTAAGETTGYSTIGATA